MNIFLGDVQGLAMLPLIFSSNVDNQQHYIGDYLSNPSLLTQGHFISLMRVPTGSNDLYLPTVTYLDQSQNVIKSLVADTSLCQPGFLSKLDANISNGLWDYIISLHSAVIADGVFQQFNIIQYTDYIRDLKHSMEIMSGTNTSTQQSQEPVQEQEQVKETQEPVQEPVQETQEPVQEQVQEPVQEPVQQQAQEQTQQDNNIIGFGNSYYSGADDDDDANSNSDYDSVSEDDAEIELEYVPLTLSTGYQTGLTNFVGRRDRETDIVVVETTEQQVSEMFNQLTANGGYAIKDMSAPIFAPTVFRYDNLISSTFASDGDLYLLDYSFKDFVNHLEELEKYNLDTLQLTNANAYRHLVLIENRLCRGKISLKDLVSLFEKSSKSTLSYQVLYDLLRYYVTAESPNGLYDNLFILPYLIKLELTLRGYSEEDIETALRFLIISLCIRQRKLKSTEYEQDNEETGDKETIYSLSSDDVAYASGQSILRNIINSTLSQEDISFTLPVVEKMDISKYLCIAARYGVPIKVLDVLNIFDMLKLNCLEIILAEYSISATILGMPVSTYVIIHMLNNAVSILNNILDPLNTSERKDRDYIAEKLQDFEYNKVLDYEKRQGNNFAEVNGYNSIPYLADYDMSVTKLVTCKLNGKLKILGSIVTVNNIKSLLSHLNEGELISYKYLFIPIGGSFYESMIENNITIEGQLEKFDDFKQVSTINVDGILKPVYYGFRLKSSVVERKGDVINIGELTPQECTPEVIKSHINKFRPKSLSDISYSKVRIIDIAKYDLPAINLALSL